MLALALTAVLAAGPTQLTIDVHPVGVSIKVDGKKAGTSGEKPLVLKLKPGRHSIRLEHKGDAHEEDVALKAGEKKTYVWKFEGGTPTPPAEPSEPSQPSQP
jgi:hypothetical protein